VGSRTASPSDLTFSSQRAEHDARELDGPAEEQVARLPGAGLNFALKRSSRSSWNHRSATRRTRAAARSNAFRGRAQPAAEGREVERELVDAALAQQPRRFDDEEVVSGRWECRGAGQDA